MKRDSSARRRSSTMVAVSVAAVVVPVVVGMSLLPGAEGIVRTMVCGPNNAPITGCNIDVLANTKVKLDCTDTTTAVVPTALLDGTAANVKVCKETALRADATTACTTEVKLGDVPGMSNPATDGTNGWTVEFANHDESTDVILTGSCIASANGLYFNFVLKATTTTQAPANNNSATSAFGLATASSVALLGLVVAAA